MPVKDIISPWSEGVRYCSQKKKGYHGGISPQEMVVPLAILTAEKKLPHHTQFVHLVKPFWWDEQSKTTDSEETHSLYDENNSIDFGPLFRQESPEVATIKI